MADRLLGTGRHIEKWPAFLKLPLKPLLLVLEGAALGILRPPDVDWMVLRSYEAQPNFYDPDRYQLPHEERLLPRLVELAGDRRDMLDAFCGQGREAEIFARAGFDVLGVDALPWMIDRARSYASKAGFSAEFAVADFFSLEESRRFEIVYTSCWMYSTLQGVERRLRFLEKCRALCADDGLIVVSYIDASAFSRLSRWMRFTIARLTALATGGNRRGEVGERLYRNLFWHHLERDTVRRELEGCGVEIVGSVPANKPHEPTFLILRPSGDPP